jgi:hypothetical protein
MRLPVGGLLILKQIVSASECLPAATLTPNPSPKAGGALGSSSTSVHQTKRFYFLNYIILL